MTINIDLRRISDLPDGMDTNSIEKEFWSIVRAYKDNPYVPSEECNLLLSTLFELSDRQWSTYTLLPNNLRDLLDSMILNFWQRESLDSTEKLLGVISRLGLVKAFSELTTLDPADLSPDVAREIQSGINEFGEGVHDPYFRM